MIIDNAQIGEPLVLYKDTKENILALSDPVEGWQAETTDTHELGYYDGTGWKWGTLETGTKIVHYHANGDSATAYPATDGNLTTVLSLMVPGDTLETPANAVFVSEHTLASGCRYNLYKGTFNAPLTLASGCYVYGAHITVTLDCGFAVGLYNPHTGTARVYDCVITAISASGEAAAFHLNYGGDVIFHETMLFGSGTDHGYSGYDGAGGGKAYVFDCDLYASSAPDYFNV